MGIFKKESDKMFQKETVQEGKQSKMFQEGKQFKIILFQKGKNNLGYYKKGKKI